MSILEKLHNFSEDTKANQFNFNSIDGAKLMESEDIKVSDINRDKANKVKSRKNEIYFCYAECRCYWLNYFLCLNCTRAAE